MRTLSQPISKKTTTQKTPQKLYSTTIHIQNSTYLSELSLSSPSNCCPWIPDFQVPLY